MVRERKTIPLLTVGCPLLAKFRSFTETVAIPFGVKLPDPVIEGETAEERLSFLKRFCGELLEGSKEHLWHRPTMRLSQDSRMSIAMSLFLFRKVLPSTPPDERAYAVRMSQPSPEPDPGFLRFVRKQVPLIFRKGWDLKLYPDACLRATLPVKACRQCKLADGGARMYGICYRWNSHQDYVLEVLTRESRVELLPARVTSVETGGKHRIVSVSDVNANLFRPLHAAMYNHLSKFPWLLRGEAKPDRFKGFEARSGEVFVSGDYESATDNLNGHLQREILDLILSNTTQVPKGIIESAPQMLRSILEVKRKGEPAETFVQERGQLMGNLLSFPLLCLVNYLGFRYYAGFRCPVRVNGDDIVFRATARTASRWMEGVKIAGLTLSRGKTLIHRRYFSLNSTMFKASWKEGSLPHLIPMIRSTAFGYRAEPGGVETLAGRFKSFAPGFYGDRRSRLRIRFLQWNRKYVLASGRSLSRGLGIRVTRAELIGANLLDREDYYLSLPNGAERPLPPRPARLEQARIPEGWSLRRVERITREMRQKSKEAGPLFVECAWTFPSEGAGMEDTAEAKWRERVRMTGFTWVPQRTSLKRRARLLGLSPRNAGRYLRPRLRDDDLRRIQSQFRKQLWLPDDWLTPNQMAAQPAVASLPLATRMLFVKGVGA
ncbi:RNA-dependent RNA polymerase [Aspergillus fumigatus botourmiavirus 1]|nr:RNA-dependent RNA polymerase [Aspergillus fumigatus botourmiavirus 1]